jgi:hypothetical protein
MSNRKYDEILRQACETLSREEQLQLARALTDTHASANTQDARTLYDALAARGIIGSITDAPADLGTNPKYMEGFGQNGR